MNLGDIVINPGMVRVAQDAAIGAIVGSQTVGIPNTGGLIWIGQCAANGYGGFNIALNVNQGTSVAGQSNVYSTNIQGIGFPDPHAWQQREYLADWGRRLQRRRSLRVYRLAPDSVRHR